MKTFTKCLLAVFTFGMVTHYAIAQSQIQFTGLVSQGEGVASWNADGSGPEPAATGHINPNTGTASTYYLASRDYITQNSDNALAHFMSNISGFPEFVQALSVNGFSPEDVKVKLGLGSYEEDIDGLDWLTLGDDYYANHYNMELLFELDGEPMLSGHLDYANHKRTGSELYWYYHSSFTKIEDVSISVDVSEVATAFLSDLDGMEITFYNEATVADVFSGTGRDGYLFNILNGLITVGNPSLPFKGLKANNEGTVAWNADGTGPEPYGNGHDDMLYYSASVDYDDINTSPDACLGHFLEGSTGFFNTLLQLQYRGFEIGDLKMKMGLISLGPDVEGEDWGVENGHDWLNEYNNVFVIEINGEPILWTLQDTNRMVLMTNYWETCLSVGNVHDISQNASADAQFVAQSFLKDLGTHLMKTITSSLSYQGPYSDGNGRSGAYYQIDAGNVMGVHDKATFVPEGPVSGTWTAEGSPYYIDGDLTIENGETLTIESSVKVAVRGPYHFNIQGAVVAQGTVDEKIMFTSSNPNIMWDGFDYDGTAVTNSPSVFNHCLFQYGQAQGGGEYNSGGVFAVRNYDNIQIFNSTFRNNLADLFDATFVTCGGAIALWNSSPLIQKCIFYDNYALDYAGAILAYTNSNPIISNCLFYNNDSQRGGALAFYSNSNGKVINSTIAENTALFGGGLYFYSQCNPEIINTILWNNEASNAGNQVYFSTGLSIPGFYYCDIEEGAAGFGGTMFNGDYLFNQETDPVFSGEEDHPYCLGSPQSPCYNGGTPDSSIWFYPNYLPITGLMDTTRILFGTIDIGAYECSLPVGIELHSEPISFFTVQPNPARSIAHFNFDLAENEMVKIELYNYLGQKMDEPFNAFQPAGSYSLPVNLEKLQQGTYIAKITKGQQIYITKFIKY